MAFAGWRSAQMTIRQMVNGYYTSFGLLLENVNSDAVEINNQEISLQVEQQNRSVITDFG